MTNQSKQDVTRARTVLLLTMAMWGINMSAVKVLTAHFDMLWLAFFRMGLATLAMLLAHAWNVPDRAAVLRMSTAQR
ncbi:MAG TPA: hypothetical protein VLJ58_17770 [Ramlibacter sp.]|nr:hypothetical protein [Ramlibacter sp.]